MVFVIPTIRGDMKTDFSTLDIVKALNIERERLRDWMTRGYVKPSVEAEGQGTRAVFTAHDAYGVALFRDLVGRGFSRERASAIVKLFMKQKGEPGSKKTSYIIIRESMEGDGVIETTIECVDSDSSDHTVDLKTGHHIPRILKDLPMLKDVYYKDDNEWRILYAVNFAALRKEVDAALGGV